MVGFFNKDDEGNYGTAEKDGSANSDNTVKSNEQASGFEQTQDGQASGSMVGIDGLMDKRIKLEESINYVGHMIKTLKDKRHIHHRLHQSQTSYNFHLGSTYGFKGNIGRRWNSNDCGWRTNCHIFASI